MKLKVNSVQFQKDMKNIIRYSEGFLDGTKAGKVLFFRNLAIEVKNILEEFIDSNASVSPQTLHHMYEWNQVGQDSGRLFKINAVANGYGIKIRFLLQVQSMLITLEELQHRVVLKKHLIRFLLDT